jgi:cytochrome c-type biogenesis protein CcmF
VTGTIAHSALLISVAVVALGIILTPVAIRSDRREWLQLVYGAVYTNFMLVTIAAVSMVVALVTHDFSVSYVAAVGSRSTPLLFTVISLWGALEGSILFWAWVLAMYAAAVVWLHHRRPGNLVPYAAMTLLAVAAFFAILLVGPCRSLPPRIPGAD